LGEKGLLDDLQYAANTYQNLDRISLNDLTKLLILKRPKILLQHLFYWQIYKQSSCFLQKKETRSQQKLYWMLPFSSLEGLSSGRADFPEASGSATVVQKCQNVFGFQFEQARYLL